MFSINQRRDEIDGDWEDLYERNPLLKLIVKCRHYNPGWL